MPSNKPSELETPQPPVRNPRAAADAADQRRVYRAPVVTVWGTLEDLTRGGGGSTDDGGSFSAFA